MIQVSFSSFIARLMLALGILAGCSCTEHRQEAPDQVTDTILSGASFYASPFGKRTQVKLADGTRVMLNSGSQLWVDTGFGQSGRSVRLSGDALFTVEKGEKEFRIRTPHLVLTTAGAVMRVSGYDQSAGEETLLLSGNLHVVKSYYSELDHEPYDLKSGEMVMMNKDIDLMEKETFDTAELEPWAAGRLEFREMTFQQVVNTLKGWYNTEVEVSGNIPADIRFTGSFRHPSLQEVLAALAKQGKFRYSAKRDPVEIKF